MSKATREKYNLPPLNITKPAPIAPPPGAVWNHLRRLWMVQTDRGVVPCDPQPPAPEFVGSGVGVGIARVLPAGTVPVLPAVKVEV